MSYISLLHQDRLQLTLSSSELCDYIKICLILHHIKSSAKRILTDNLIQAIVLLKITYGLQGYGVSIADLDAVQSFLKRYYIFFNLYSSCITGA